MKGDNHLLALTTKTVTATDDPSLAEGETRLEPLFAFPVQICKATEDIDVKFDIAAPSGAPRKQVYMDESTSEIVEDADCLRGVRLSETDFRVIPDEAITEVRGQKSNMMVVEGTVALHQLAPQRTSGFYYVQSPVKGGSAKAYRLVYEALRAQRAGTGKKILREARALVLKRTPRTNEKLCAIYADEDRGCLAMVQMVFAAQIREPDAQVLAPQTAEVTQAQIDMAVQVVNSLTDGADFLATAEDVNVPRKRDLMEKALEGETIAAPTPIAATVETDDLMGALEASLATA